MSIKNKINNNLQKTIIGIIGGSGPEATIDIQKKLLKSMQEKLQPLWDQDYFGVIVDNNPQFPDRTNAFLSGDKNIINLYINRIRNLERLGVNVVIIACNTAHVFFNHIQQSISIKMLNIIIETAQYFVNTYPNIKKVGLLSTLGTLNSKIYQTTFLKYGIEVVLLDHNLQIKIHQAIYGIKAGYISNSDIEELTHKNKLNQIYTKFNANINNFEITSPQNLIIEALNNIKDQGITHTILGCTELPLAIDQNNCKGQILIDPNKLISYSLINYCLESITNI